jgi:hypothetical protein
MHEEEAEKSIIQHDANEMENRMNGATMKSEKRERFRHHMTAAWRFNQPKTFE